MLCLSRLVVVSPTKRAGFSYQVGASTPTRWASVSYQRGRLSRFRVGHTLRPLLNGQLCKQCCF